MRLPPTAITALAYFLLGSTGLALAIPPGYASPVFPAAGLAVAMVLGWGNRALPGVWIGSLGVNIIVSLKDGSSSSASLFLSAGCVAFGAVAQAWCARELVARRLGDRWRRLESENDVLQLLFFAGPLACVVAASVGVATLKVWGVIGTSEVGFSWWTWWVGDTLGVLIFAPLTLIFLFRTDAPWKARQLSVAVPTLIVLVFASAAFVATSGWERQHQMDGIATTGEELVQKLESRIAAHHEALASLRRLIDVMPDLDYEQFDYFTRLTLGDNRDISALSINAYVPRDARAAFESSMRRSTPFKDFRVVERNEGGELVTAGSRPNYVSVAFIAPLAGNVSAVGYDIYSEPVRREAIDRAIRTRAPAATAPIRLVQENRKHVGQLVLHPAYRAREAASSTALPVAFAVGVIKTHEMIEIALGNRLPRGLVFNVSDTAGPEETRALYRSHPENATPPAGYLWHSAVAMANRSWDVEVFPTQQYLNERRPWGAWLVGIGGMLFAALLQLLIFGITGRSFAVQRRVEEQTREILSKSDALQASLNEHDSLIQRIPVGVFKAHFSAHGVVRFEYVSPLWCSQRGVDAVDVLRDPGLAMRNIHPQDRSSLQAGINSAHEKGAPFAWQGRVVRDGAIGWFRVEASPTRLENGDLVWDGIQIDITSQKASEENQRLLSTAMSQSNAAIVVTDSSGNIAFVNDALVKTTDFSRDEVFGRNPRIFKSGDTDIAVYRDLWRTITSRQTWRGEIKNRKKSGELYWEFATISPVIDEAGNITHFIAIKENITERKQKDVELQRAKEAAEAASVAKSRFLATMSHEIRTPMNGIIGLSQLALEKEVSAEGRSYLEKIYMSSQSLLRILNDVLDYSKIESGRMALENAPFDLDNLLDRLRGLFALTAEEKRLDFSIVVGSDVPRALIGDSLRLQQVLSNLLGNAIKFTDDGRVKLTISLGRILASQATLLFVVTDDGIGMDSAVRAELFQPFHQADSSVGRRFGGSGLGLAISRELLHLMGSEFEVESVPGEGSAFKFEVPFEIALEGLGPNSGSRGELGSPVSSRVRRVALSRRLVGKRILVAEDNMINQRVVLEFLKMFGMEVSVAANGKLALGLLESMRFDAVLMDLHMPEMDGFEATRRIRERSGFADFPILALTAAVTPGERSAALACGMNDIVTKPVDPEKLISALLDWIPETPVSAVENGPPRRCKPSPGHEVQLPSGPSFDFTNLLDLVGGNKGTAAALLRSFFDDMRHIVDDIAEALADGDMSGAKKLIHRLSGASGNIGAVALHRAAEQVDRQLGQDLTAAPSLAVLQVNFSETMAELTAFGDGQPRKKVVDETRLCETMAKLKQLLVSQLLVPEELLAQLGALVPEAQTEDFEHLASCVGNIDYPAALDIIRRMAEGPGGS